MAYAYISGTMGLLAQGCLDILWAVADFGDIDSRGKDNCQVKADVASATTTSTFLIGYDCMHVML